MHPEKQYLNLIKNIIKNGMKEHGRNGATKTIMGAMMKFPLTNNQIPFVTTKRLAWRTCFKELFWFINGDTDNKKLKKKNVKIWNGNGSREFLDSRGLRHYEEDDLGPIYGYQWRHFDLPYRNAEHYEKSNLRNLNNNPHVRRRYADQLQDIIDSLNSKEERNSRRLVMSAWNPNQLKEMALPPCHILSQFSVLDNKLYCNMYQRSGDVGLGIPFNIASYSLLTILLAKHCNLEPGEFIHHIGNAHIYEEHEEALKQQILREPKDFPLCTIKNKYDNIGKYSFKDINIENYEYHDEIKMTMKV
jgi:thymidylate synthase